MHIEQDNHGNMQIYQNMSKKYHWGFIDKEKDYITTRSEKKGQIFHHFRNAVAIQLELLEYLEKMKANLIKVWIPDFEKEGFWALVKVESFRQIAREDFGERAIFNYDKEDYSRYGKQIRLPLNRFSRAYTNTKPLTEFM